MFRFLIVLLFMFSTSAFADVWTFETPSENIQCTVGHAEDFSDLTCAILQRSGSPALPRPPGCTTEWGHVFFMLDRGPVEMQCSNGKHSKSGHDVAEYGVTGEFGGFTCHSSKKGFQCTNRDGNGFFLSRKRQSIIGTAKNEHSQSAVTLNTTSDKEGKLLSIIGKEVADGCRGAGGTFKSKGIIEIDLNADGSDDLVLAHQNLECNGEFELSNKCGTQVCSIKAYLYTDGSFQLAEEFLGRITGYSWSPHPVFEIMGHGEKHSQWKPNFGSAQKNEVVTKAVLKVPVLERAEPEGLPTCAASSVKGVKSFLAVRNGPGTKFEKIDELANGEVVYVFDNRGEWAGVVYRTNNVECSSQSTRKVPYNRAGWVHKNWLIDLAG